MGKDLPQLWKPVEVPGGFKKGMDPRRNKGGQDAKLRRVRKALARFDRTALETLKAMFDSGHPDLVVEALKFWGKYRLPVPTEPEASDAPAQARSLKNFTAEQLAEFLRAGNEPPTVDH